LQAVLNQIQFTAQGPLIHSVLLENSVASPQALFTLNFRTVAACLFKNRHLVAKYPIWHPLKLLPMSERGPQSELKSMHLFSILFWKG